MSHRHNNCCCEPCCEPCCNPCCYPFGYGGGYGGYGSFGGYGGGFGNGGCWWIIVLIALAFFCWKPIKRDFCD